MKFKFLLCFLLLLSFGVNICFAGNSKKSSEDNPYGFELVEEADRINAAIEISENDEDVDMEDVNKNDTYQAQKNADSAEMKRLDNKAAQITNNVNAAAVKKETAVKKEEPLIAGKVQQAFNKFKQKPEVNKILKIINTAWTKFKSWFVKLPGIRHWLDSPYSMENYRKELGRVDYVEKKAKKDQLKKDSESAQMLKEGKNKFFK
ncbi:MAG: hypothetical protein FWH43_01840 [Endomicrobia bacterium]|nr:hypothetical protein [Endomicrobiia bacterium]